jgi:hypothetical protein
MLDIMKWIADSPLTFLGVCFFIGWGVGVIVGGLDG